MCKLKFKLGSKISPRNFTLGVGRSLRHQITVLRWLTYRILKLLFYVDLSTNYQFFRMQDQPMCSEVINQVAKLTVDEF
jgi:hypothetical protein